MSIVANEPRHLNGNGHAHLWRPTLPPGCKVRSLCYA